MKNQIYYSVFMTIGIFLFLSIFLIKYNKNVLWSIPLSMLMGVLIYFSERDKN